MDHVCVLANNHINHKVFAICCVLSFQFFLQLLCISLVSLIFRYSAHILLENTLFCRQNARLKTRLFCSKFCWQNLSKPKFSLPYIIKRFCALTCSRVSENFTGNWGRSRRWRLVGRLEYSFETLGVSSAWEVHGMHPGMEGARRKRREIFNQSLACF